MDMAWDDDADLCLQHLLILYHTQNAIRCEKLCANLLRVAPMPTPVCCKRAITFLSRMWMAAAFRREQLLPEHNRHFFPRNNDISL